MIRELRHDYHDRIARLRVKSIGIINVAVGATRTATAILISQQASSELPGTAVGVAVDHVREVEAGVLALLARQAPVSRDLRMILTARDISQRGELCLGLCTAIIRAAPGTQGVLNVTLRTLAGQVGQETADLLGLANRAWVAVDPEQASAVIVAAAESRQLQSQLLVELVGLHHVPTDAAVDLGVVLRAYERLTDHSIDIASRVIFTATGTRPGQVFT